jgi:hypothetical protein
MHLAIATKHEDISGMTRSICTALSAAVTTTAILAASSAALAQNASSIRVEPDAVIANKAAINRCVELYGDGFMPVGESESCVKFSGDVRITYSSGTTTTKNTVKLPPGVTLPARP